MKKSLLLAFAAVLITFSHSSFCQIQETIKTERGGKRANAVVEPGVVDDVVMDARALKHYSEQDIKIMPTVKKMQVNYLYKNSFLPDADNQYSQLYTEEFLKSNFDVADFNNKREESKRV